MLYRNDGILMVCRLERCLKQFSLLFPSPPLSPSFSLHLSLYRPPFSITIVQVYRWKIGIVGRSYDIIKLYFRTWATYGQPICQHGQYHIWAQGEGGVSDSPDHENEDLFLVANLHRYFFTLCDWNFQFGGYFIDRCGNAPLVHGPCPCMINTRFIGCAPLLYLYDVTVSLWYNGELNIWDTRYHVTASWWNVFYDILLQINSLIDETCSFFGC